MFFEDKIEKINHILKKLKNHKVAVWCLGRHTEKLLEYTEILKYDVRFFVDKNADSYMNYEAYGKKVYFPEKANFKEVDYIVLSTYRRQDEILTDLKHRGIQEKAVLLYAKEDEGEFYLLPEKDNNDFYFTGDFCCWEDAKNSVVGYEDETIAQKVLFATKQVIENKACYERDSVLFYTPEFNFRLICVFALLASRKKHVNILDFGGALGSEYWKNRQFLYRFGLGFTWNVVEQNTYVALGKREVANAELKFYSSISEVKGKTDFVIISGVLQYLPDYESVLHEIMGLDADYILIERQVVSEKERFCVQYVGENIYCASYPVHILAEKKLLDIFEERYWKITEFASEVDGPKAYVDGKEFNYKGYLMERKKNENT